VRTRRAGAEAGKADEETRGRQGAGAGAAAGVANAGSADIDELLEWLGRHDALTLGERLARLRFLVALNEKHAAGWVGFYNQAHEYLEYGARCYLEGLFVPCIIMCHTAIEEQMRGLLRSLGLEELADSPMSEVLRDKRVRQTFPRKVLRRLEVLRSRRNLYIHPPGPLDAEGYLDSRWLPHRMAARKLEAEELQDEDARAALLTVAHLFAIGPGMGLVPVERGRAK